VAPPLAAWILTPLESGLLYTALAVYIAGTVVGLRILAGRRGRRAIRPLLLVGGIALTLMLVAIILREMHPPFLRRYEVVVASTWALGVGGWVVDRRLQQSVLTAVSAPCLALLTVFAFLLVPEAGARVPDVVPGKILHVVLAMFGFIGFTVAAGTGALYLWQIRVLKRNPTAAVARRMPALERLDRLNFLAAASAFPFLTLSVVAGWLFLAVTPESAAQWWLDPTVLVTLGGLLVYVVLFLARSCLGWYGRRIAWLTVIGFVVTVVGFVVAKLCTSPSAFHTT
jgi:ABC-type transport system involved in cytochrome c biogenesis permease subunit